jgi:hypothetical protein
MHWLRKRLPGGGYWRACSYSDFHGAIGNRQTRDTQACSSCTFDSVAFRVADLNERVADIRQGAIELSIDLQAALLGVLAFLAALVALLQLFPVLADLAWFRIITNKIVIGGQAFAGTRVGMSYRSTRGATALTSRFGRICGGHPQKTKGCEDGSARSDFDHCNSPMSDNISLSAVLPRKN